MRPVKKNVLFKPFPGDEKSEGGLVVPEAFRKPSDKGTIVGVGAGVTKVKEGQIAYRVHGWGDEIDLGGQKHFLMNEDAILGVQ